MERKSSTSSFLRRSFWVDESLRTSARFSSTSRSGRRVQASCILRTVPSCRPSSTAATKQGWSCRNHKQTHSRRARRSLQTSRCLRSSSKFWKDTTRLDVLRKMLGASEAKCLQSLKLCSMNQPTSTWSSSNRTSSIGSTWCCLTNGMGHLTMGSLNRMHFLIPTALAKIQWKLCRVYRRWR